MAFSRIVPVRQKFPDRSIRDIPGEVQRQLAASGFASKLKPGSRVAIGCGSRGITNIAKIVRAVADFWKSAGMRPFVFPAMGTHGAATAAGQADVLAHYGIHEAGMGCPVISSLDVVPLGRTEDGIEAFLDKNAYDSDGVMMVGRVKWHTDFAGALESGLFKMMAIGLGKFAGAQRYHTYAYKLGLEHVVRSVGRQVLKSGKILGGLAVLEDANHSTAKLEAVPVGIMERREEELLALTKSWMGRVPVKEVDLLIVDEIGKNFSGAGMDTKVINRGTAGEYNYWFEAPKVNRIFGRDLSDLSYGSAIGIGLCDMITDRLLNGIDWVPTHLNSLTANTPAMIRVPIHFATDRECMEKLWPTVGKFNQEEVTIGWIRNTMELALLGLSENLLPEIRQNPDLEVVGEATEFAYDGNGYLLNPYLALAEAAAAH
jgi:hypothetical protein